MTNPIKTLDGLKKINFLFGLNINQITQTDYSVNRLKISPTRPNRPMNTPSSDEVAEEDPEEDFAKLAEKVSSLVEEAKSFDDISIEILLNYTLELYLFY